MKKLSIRDMRALKIGLVGLVGIVAVIAFMLGMAWLENWAEIRRSLAESKRKFEQAGQFQEKYRSISSAVPILEVPKKEQEQQYSFRAEFNKQLNQAGIKVKPLKFVPASKSPVPQYRLLCLECSGKANLDQIFNLLADLKKNPYLAAVEEFAIKKADPKNEKSREFELNMKISTFVRK